jgi:hypothetical protein
MALDQTRSNEILSWMHGGGSPPTLTALNRIKLLTAIGNATTPGTEVATGGGYTQVAAGTTGGIAIASWAAASAGSQATSAAASVTNYPRAETVTSIEIYDNNVGTPKRIEYGALTTSRTMAAGDTLSFASGAVTSALA